MCHKLDYVIGYFALGGFVAGVVTNWRYPRRSRPECNNLPYWNWVVGILTLVAWPVMGAYYLGVWGYLFLCEQTRT